jgi:hypothetical protein
MELTPCFSDPYAHWLPSSPSEGAASGTEPIPNRFMVAGGLVPIVVRATIEDHVNDIVSALETARQGRKVEGFGNYRLGTAFASLLIEASVVFEWLQKFEEKGIAFEIGAPFSSAAAMYPAAMITGDSTEVQPDQPPQVRVKSKAKKLIGIIDYGCAFANEKFCKLVDGKKSTRVLAIWDQHQRGPGPSDAKNGYTTLSWEMTTDYGYGVQALREWPNGSSKIGLNEFMHQFDSGTFFDDALCYQYANYPALELREATHGTYIMDFAAGIPSPLKGLTDELACDWASDSDTDIKDADIVFVQLPRNFQGEQVSGILRTYVLDAIMYILRAAGPDPDVVINLSYGGFAGPHDGSSLIEQAIDEQVDLRVAQHGGKKTEIVVCSGNSASSNMHTFRKVEPQNQQGEQASVELSVIPDNPSLQFVEMWVDGANSTTGAQLSASLSIKLPDGSDPLSGINVQIGLGNTFPLKNSKGVVIGRICLPKPSSGLGGGGYRVLIGLNPTVLCAGGALSSSEALAPIGIWQIQLTNRCDLVLSWGAWCERHDPIFGSGYGPRQIKFVEGTSLLATTSNLASTGGKRIIVGGSILRSPEYLAEYTGRGPYRQLERLTNQDELDNGIVYAPCEENLSYLPLAGAGVLGQSKVRYSGTSVSAAVVTRMLISGWTVAGLRALTPPSQTREVFP